MSDNDQLGTPAQSLNLSALSRVKRFGFALRKWWWILLITTAAGVCLAAWKDSKKAPVWVSESRMMISGKISLPEGAVYSEELSMFFGTQSELMQSAKVRKRAAERVDSKHPELQKVSVALSVSPQPGTTFFVLRAVGAQPEYTQAYLEACMDEYMRVRRDLRSETSENALVLITDQLLKLEKDVDLYQDDVLAFQKTHNVAFLEQEGNSAGKYLAELNQTLSSLRMENDLLKVLDLDQNLERQKAPSTPSAQNDNSTENGGGQFGAASWYLQGKQKMQLLTAEKERRAKVLRASHPIIIRLDAEIAQQARLIELFREQSLTQINSKRESIRLQIENLEDAVKKASEEALELTRKISEYNRLKGKVDRAKSLYDRLLASIQSVDVGRNLQADVVTIMDHASPPYSIVPGLAKDLSIGGAIGLLLGVGIVFLLGMLDERIASIVELQERFPEQVLAHIPFEPSDERLNLIALDDKHHVFAESYRNLRSTLYFMPFVAERPRTFLVTSAVPGEGKSTVAANLAITIAGGGARTLLVDGDLRKGVIHEYFDAASAPGLATVFREGMSWRDVVLETSVKNLSFIPRGQAGTGSSEDFLSRTADTILKEITSEFDCVIFDSAPVLANDDTPSLAPKMDAIIFVVRAGVSSARLTRSALDALYRRQANVLGLVLNAADGRSSEYYYYHKYGEYYGVSAAEPDFVKRS